MQSSDRVRHAYDVVAESYAADFFDELDDEPFDRERLDELAARVTGRVLDVGCGPGHVTRYLSGHGLEAAGLDLSSQMAAIARQRSPSLSFAVGDMRALPIARGALGGLVARYSIIHLDRADVPGAMREFRVLRAGGALLLVVHIGAGEVHVDEFRGHPVAMDATLFAPEELEGLVMASGFVLERVRRRPPMEHEYSAEKLSVLAVAGAGDPERFPGSGTG